MKDLLAKLDELHAKATPGEWDYEPRGVSCDPADDVHTLRAGDRNLSTGSKWEGTVLLCDAEAIVELHNHWKEVRAYIASLEELAGYADSMLDLAAERGVEYDIARECLDRALCEVGIR